MARTVCIIAILFYLLSLLAVLLIPDQSADDAPLSAAPNSKSEIRNSKSPPLALALGGQHANLTAPWP